MRLKVDSTITHLLTVHFQTQFWRAETMRINLKKEDQSNTVLVPWCLNVLAHLSLWRTRTQINSCILTHIITMTRTQTHADWMQFVISNTFLSRALSLSCLSRSRLTTRTAVPLGFISSVWSRWLESQYLVLRELSLPARGAQLLTILDLIAFHSLFFVLLLYFTLCSHWRYRTYSPSNNHGDTSIS